MAKRIANDKQQVRSNITIENARIGFRNFSGVEGQFNPKGQRNFCIFLEDELSEILLADGWNVKFLEPRDPEDNPQPYLKVGVTFSHYPPKIILISGAGKKDLTEETINILDWAESSNIDLIVRPYNWEVNNKTGVKAYLKTMYFTMVEDPLEAKYRNVPDSASNVIDEPPWD